MNIHIILSHSLFLSLHEDFKEKKKSKKLFVQSSISKSQVYLIFTRNSFFSIPVGSGVLKFMPPSTGIFALIKSFSHETSCHFSTKDCEREELKTFSLPKIILAQGALEAESILTCKWLNIFFSQSVMKRGGGEGGKYTLSFLVIRAERNHNCLK